MITGALVFLMIQAIALNASALMISLGLTSQTNKVIDTTTQNALPPVFATETRVNVNASLASKEKLASALIAQMIALATDNACILRNCPSRPYLEI